MRELIHNKDLIKTRWTEGSKTVGAIIMEANKKSLKLTLYNRYEAVIDNVIVKSKSN